MSGANLSRAVVERLQRVLADEDDHALLRRAVERGLISPGQAQGAMTERHSGADALRNAPKSVRQVLLDKGWVPSSVLEELCDGLRNESLSRVSNAVDRTMIATGDLQERPAEADPAPPPATSGRFELKEKLGSGGMGEVWKAWDTRLKRWSALKFLREESPEDVTRFSREAQTAAKLSHPHIAAIYEVGKEGGRRFIAMQYVEGRTLSEFRRDDVRALVEAVRQTAAAVHYAHGQGVIHRDLKPGNVMVSGREGVHAFVLDFGLAKSVNVEQSISVSGAIVGTPAYMSPEQARGSAELDGRTDVYGLGATLYELLTDRAPFEGRHLFYVINQVLNDDPRPVRALRPAVDMDLDTIVMKCLEKDPARRYATAQELADELRRYLDGDAILAHPPSTAYRFRKWARRRRALLAVGVAGLLLAGGVAGFLVPKWVGAARAEERERESRLKELERREKARPFEEAGRRILEQMRLRMRDADYAAPEILGMARLAENEFTKALGAYPEHPESLLGIGRARALAGDRKGALPFIDRAIAASPSFASAYLDRVRLDLERHAVTALYHVGHVGVDGSEEERRRKEFERDLAMAKTHSRDAAERLFVEAVMAGMSLGIPRSVEIMEEYLKVAPSDPAAHYWKAIFLHFLKRIPEAEAELDRALACDARYGAAFGLRASIRGDRGKVEEAIADYGRAIEINPRNSSAYTNRGNLYLSLGRLDAAISDFGKSIEINPTDDKTHIGRGAARSAQGDPEGAIADYDRAIALNPGRHVPFANRAGLRFQKSVRLAAEGKTAEADEQRRLALEDLDRVASPPSKHTGPILMRAEIRQALGDAAGARADLERVVAIDPRTVDARLHESHSTRARAMQRLGDLDGAIAEYGLAIEANPSLAGSYVARAGARSAKGDTAGATADYEKALTLLPAGGDDHARVLAARDAQRGAAWMRELQSAQKRVEANDYAEAKALYEKGLRALEADAGEVESVLRSGPRSRFVAMARYNLACCLALEDRLAEAEAELHRSIELGYDDRGHLERDADFAKLRGDAAWGRIIGHLEGLPSLGADVVDEGGMARVKSVLAGACAEKAGLRPGDVVRAVGDRVVSSAGAVGVALRARRAGERVALGIRRGAEELRIEVVLDPRSGR